MDNCIVLYYMKCKYKCIAIDSGQLLFIVLFDEYFGSRCCDCKKNQESFSQYF